MGLSYYHDRYIVRFVDPKFPECFKTKVYSVLVVTLQLYVNMHTIIRSLLLNDIAEISQRFKRLLHEISRDSTELSYIKY